MTAQHPATPSIIFVCGCPRSGTSALSWGMAQLDGLWTSAESHFLYRMLAGHYPASPLHQAYDISAHPGSWLDLNKVSRNEFLGAVGEGILALTRQRGEGRTFVDSSPEHLLVAPALLDMFAACRIIHIVRDPRAVCLSMLNSGFDTPWATDLDAAIETWATYARRGVALREMNDPRVLSVRQEDIGTTATATEMARHVGHADPQPILDFLNKSKINSSFKPGSYQPGGRFTPSDSLSSQEFQATYAATVVQRCGDLMKAYGYAAEEAGQP